MLRIKFRLGLVLMLALIPLMLSDCDKEEEKARDFYLFDVKAESDWDYLAIAKDGSSFTVRQVNSKPSVVYFNPVKGVPGYTIYADEKGVPSKAVIGDYIFLFGNFRQELMDISVVLPNGTINVFRDVPTEYDFTSLAGKGLQGQGADIIRWTGHIISAASCGLGWAAAVPTGGISLTLAYIGCGAMVAGIAAEFLPEDFEILGLSSTAVGTATGLIGCGQSLGLTCLLDLTSLGLEIDAAAMEDLEAHINDIRSANAILEYGYGDIQVNLTWSNNADLDIHVMDPSGEEIYWYHDYSNSGGLLDVDDTDGFGPENIFWQTGQAPLGTYNVYLHHFVWSSQSYRPETSDYTIIVTAFNHSKTFRGTISKGQTIHIATFDKNGIQPGSKNSIDLSHMPDNKELRD